MVKVNKILTVKKIKIKKLKEMNGEVDLILIVDMTIDKNIECHY